MNNNHSKTQAENCPDPSKILGTFSINAFVINIAIISFLFKFLIGGQLLYDVVLVSALQKCESAIYVLIFPLPSLTPIPTLWQVIAEQQIELPVIQKFPTS